MGRLNTETCRRAVPLRYECESDARAQDAVALVPETGTVAGTVAGTAVLWPGTVQYSTVQYSTDSSGNLGVAASHGCLPGR